MAAMSHCMRAVLLGTLLSLASAILPAAKCPVLPVGAFPAAAELRAMTCIDPGTVTGPINRIGNLVLSDLAGISSKDAKCDSPNGELKAMMPVGAGTLTAGPSKCSLVAVGFSKTSAKADAAVQMRLDFDNCTAGAPATAVVLMNVVKVKDFMAPATVFPFMKQVCSVKTTTAAESLAATKIGFIETLVGNNTCAGVALRSYEKVDRHACKMLCISDVQRAVQAMGNDPTGLTTDLEVCRGYSFDKNAGAAGEICKLYKGAGVTKVSDPAGKKGLNCWNLTATVATATVSTPAPETAAQVKKEEDALPLLKLDVSTKAKSASVSTFVAPGNVCYAPFTIVTLDNLQDEEIAINVKESEWEEFLDLIPEPSARRLEAAAAAAVAQVYVDRAVYGAVGAVANSATAKPECTPVAAPTSNGAVVFIVNLVLGVGCIFTMVLGAFGCNVHHAHAKIKEAHAAHTKSTQPLE